MQATLNTRTVSFGTVKASDLKAGMIIKELGTIPVTLTRVILFMGDVMTEGDYTFGSLKAYNHFEPDQLVEFFELIDISE